MPFSKRNQDIIRAFMSEHDIPGAAVAIVQDGKIAAEGGFGLADISREIPASEHTRWPICSLTKAFTGTAAMQLAERGALSLDEPVQTYLRGFRVRDQDASRKMTVRLFLRHNSGMGRTGHQDRLRESTSGNPYPTRASLVGALCDVDLQSDPGRCWSYCNEGYTVAGHVIETVARKPLERVFEEDIFARAGMHESSTRFSHWRAADDRIAPYARGDQGPFDTGERHPGGLPGQSGPAGYTVVRLPDDYQAFLSTGGIISTAHDLALFQIASMDRKGGPLLSGGSLDHAQSVQFGYGDTGWGYGFGWQVFWSGATKVVGHAGGLPGVSTYSLMVPSERTGVVILTNRGDRKVFLLAEQLLGDITGRPPFRKSSAGPLPFKTGFRLPKTGQGAPAEYAGEYMRGSVTCAVSTHSNPPASLRLFLSGQRGAPDQDLALVAVGPDAFLDQNLASIVHFVRDGAGRILRVLNGGYAYERR